MAREAARQVARRLEETAAPTPPSKVAHQGLNCSDARRAERCRGICLLLRYVLKYVLNSVLNVFELGFERVFCFAMCFVVFYVCVAWLKVLADEEGFYIFANFCVLEYSVERYVCFCMLHSVFA